MGTLTNITQRQDTSWVNAPPATRPIAPPAADTVVNRPMARIRWATVGKDGGQEGQRGRRRQRGAHPLQGPGRKEHPPGDGQPAEQGAQGEDGNAGQECPAPAEEVTGPSPQQEEATEREQVGVQDPGEVTPREPEALLDVWERDVDDRRVQDHHQLGGQDHEEEHGGMAEPASYPAGPARIRVGSGAGRDPRVASEGIVVRSFRCYRG